MLSANNISAFIYNSKGQRLYQKTLIVSFLIVMRLLTTAFPAIPCGTATSGVGPLSGLTTVLVREHTIYDYRSYID